MNGSKLMASNMYDWFWKPLRHIKDGVFYSLDILYVEDINRSGNEYLMENLGFC